MTRTYLLTLLVWLATYNGWAQGLPAQVASGNVVLPSADISVADTLDAPFKLGFAMHGPAPAWGHRLNSSLRGNCSLLYWRGPDDGRPMFRYTGSMGLLSGFCLSGKYHESERTPEKLTLFALHSGPAGMGTGKVDLSNVTFSYADCGIEIGKDLHDKNCDNLTGTNLRFHSCKTAVRLRGHMAMHSNFGKVEARNCENVIEAFAGGDTSIESLFVVGATTVLKVGLPGPGSNNGVFEFKGIKTDQQAGSKFKLLDMVMPELESPGVYKTFPCMIDVKYDGRLIAFDSYTANGDILVNAIGNTKVKIENLRNLQGRTIRATPLQHKGEWFQPHIVIENCRIGAGTKESLSELLTEDSKPPYTLIVRDCCDMRGKPLPNVELYK